MSCQPPSHPCIQHGAAFALGVVYIYTLHSKEKHHDNSAKLLGGLEKGPQKAKQWLLPDLKGWDRANEGSRNIFTITAVNRKQYFVP